MKKKMLSAISPIFIFPGKRLDRVLADIFVQYSRSYLKKLILCNKVLINKKIENSPDKKIVGGEKIIIYPDFDTFETNIPENIFLNIIYEDNEILVIDKPVGIVVHPGSGNTHGTILNALLYRYKNIHNLPRAGIVHRLDKNTSGLMVIAKNMYSYIFLLNLLKKRKIIREYQAVVQGNMISGGIINKPITRHKTKKICMMVSTYGKRAITYYKIINRFKNHTHVLVRLGTGRTHQIRVHMLYIGFPIIGDHLYRRGTAPYISNDYNKTAAMIINNFPRQALHASYLSFFHPTIKKIMHWHSALPKDMKGLVFYLSQ